MTGGRRRWAPIPSLLGISAVHHHLARVYPNRGGTDSRNGRAAGRPQFACLIGYGAGTINPYLVFESLVDMERDNYLPEGLDAQTAEGKFIKAINKGLQDLLEDGHLHRPVVLRCANFRGNRIEPRDYRPLFHRHAVTGGRRRDREIGEETLRRHRVAYEPAAIRQLDFGGDYRIQGEHHNWNPDTIYKLQHASQSNDPKTYAEFAQLVNDESTRRSNLRGLLDFKFDRPRCPSKKWSPRVKS